MEEALGTTEVETDGEPLTAEDAVADFLDGILEYGNLNLDFTYETLGNELHINFTGKDVGGLIGRGAELLNALEHLAERIAARYAAGELHVRCDANNYRAGRERELRMMADAAAAQVLKFQRSFTFGPMSASERRVIHLVLAANPAVRTESIGNGDDRKIVVHPA